MNYLAIDTSTDLATVALSCGDEIVSEEQMGTRQHAQVLLPMIEQVLSSASITLSQLDGIVFGKGPGSFTGLRIACSIAKALAYAHDLPVYPVSSLAAIAAAALAMSPSYSQGTQVLAVLDARMHELYWAFFNDSMESSEAVSPAGLIVPPSEKSIVLAGVGFEEYLPSLSPAVHHQIISHHNVFPHAKTMLGLVQSGDITAVEAKNAQPTYVRNHVTQGVPRG